MAAVVFINIVSAVAGSIFYGYHLNLKANKMLANKMLAHSGLASSSHHMLSLSVDVEPFLAFIF